MARSRVERNISYDDKRKRYYVNLEFGLDPETGKQIKKTKTYEKITQARAALRKHEAARDMGQVVRPKEITVQQWLSEWMNNVIKLSRAVTTVYAYQHIIDAHIVPELGNTPIQSLSPQQLQSYYAKLIRERGLSSNTARKHHDLLNTALKTAVKQGMIMSNPAERVEAPKVRRPEIHFYSLEELQRLLRLCGGTRIEVLVKLAALLGLRREEILGLTWDCVDFHQKRIEVKFVRTSAGNVTVQKEPKTMTSHRTLHMPAELEDALLRERERQLKLQEFLGHTYPNQGYVFSLEDGKPVRPNYASELFAKFIRENRLPPLTLHGLRHSFASIANAKGIPMYDIGKALGHSSPATTSKIYTHLLDPDHKDLLERMWEDEKKKEDNERTSEDQNS